MTDIGIPDYDRIDPAIISGLERYEKHGVPPGGFVRAVLENNLREAFGRADEHNRAVLFDIVSYCYNNLNACCWGSAEVVDAWLAMKAKERADAGTK